MTLSERTADMLDRYGEVCTKKLAAKILGCSEKTVAKMVEDGRIELACGGAKVDMRSVAAYICEPAKKDFEARIRKVKERNSSSWAV